MKRVLLLVVLAALIVAPAASARRGDFFHTDEKKAAALEAKINSYRIKHNKFLLWPASNLYSGAYGLNWSNYQTGQVSNNLFGVPFQKWIEPFMTPSNELYTAMIRRGKCHGGITPRKVMKSFRNHRATRRVLKNRWSQVIGIHVSEFKRKKGDFKGKGVCNHYTAIFAS